MSLMEFHLLCVYYKTSKEFGYWITVPIFSKKNILLQMFTKLCIMFPFKRFSPSSY